MGFLHKLVRHWSLTLHSESPTRLAEFSFKHSKADSPTHRVGESFFDYEYLREFEAKIGTVRKVV